MAINLATIYSLKSSKELRTACADLLTARAHARATRERVDAYIAPVFARFTFADRSGKPIAKSVDLYRSKDAGACVAFYAACDDAHKANGFDVAAGVCPALVAECAAGRAENPILRIVSDALGADFAGRANVATRAAVIDTILRVVA